MPIIRAYREPDAEGAAKVEAGKGVPMYFTAATAGVKADGIDISRLPWSFARNIGAGPGGEPEFPVLWCHDLRGRPYGVARVLTKPDEWPTRMEVIWNPERPESVELERDYLSPVSGLRAVSVQWEIVDADGMPSRMSGKKAVANELWELSGTPVGLDSDALRDNTRVAMRALIAEILEERAAEAIDVTTVTETETIETIDADLTVTIESDDEPTAPDADTAEAQPERLAAEMVAIFEAHRWADDADAERRVAYKALLPRYRLAGWTAPEFVPMADLCALDDGTWRGLFLAGELQRVGAELSTKNVTELREIAATVGDASKRLNAMLTRVTAAKEPPADDAADDGERALTPIEELAAAYLRITQRGTNNG